jgi:hypothetical protein
LSSIQEQTLATQAKENATPQGDHQEVCDVDGMKLTIAITKK